MSPNEVIGNRLFQPLGAYVDRSATPNRVYVFDSGNNRVLAMSAIGHCKAGTKAGQGCTGNSDCPLSTCFVEETRGADLVLGQTSFSSSGCNGDTAYQNYPDVPQASAGTLCLLREEQLSPGEGGSVATLTTDPQGNLYVPDIFNNRVLRYESPFTTDTLADSVWGQSDFSGITCNRGASFGMPNARSLCLGTPPGIGDFNSGVAIDAQGNLWVADNENHRVLRFSFTQSLGRPAPEANWSWASPTSQPPALGLR